VLGRGSTCKAQSLRCWQPTKVIQNGPGIEALLSYGARGSKPEIPGEGNLTKLPGWPSERVCTYGQGTTLTRPLEAGCRRPAP
jgi:hypothetical protein